MNDTRTIIDPFNDTVWTVPLAVPVSARHDLEDVEYAADARAWLGEVLRRRSLRQDGAE
jgi:hypothetical protein